MRKYRKMLILVKFPSFYLNTALIDNYGSPIRMRVVKKRRFERSPQKKKHIYHISPERLNQFWLATIQ